MKKNLLLILFVIILAIFPLFLQKGAEFGGADGEAEAEIGNIAPDYEPWFSSILEPPSGEIESLLFSLQAGLGAGFIGYFIGFSKGKKKKNNVDQKE
ncbi:MULTISPECIES: energy-coupling factor ABC transporter substrate-binding protein [Bacillus]|uniref:energy-coupling factor ABC transporter substrate-binding protein n=1 Tax=Bacillus TaxID=1386 RepID=UPI0002F76A6B|nr:MULTISPECIES: energy-coupling factor ABC transporter substrate-binding protein [Bacillus]